jgi:hypothetical protein
MLDFSPAEFIVVVLFASVETVGFCGLVKENSNLSFLSDKLDF